MKRHFLASILQKSMLALVEAVVSKLLYNYKTEVQNYISCAEIKLIFNSTWIKVRGEG
jgi:hypothetical protein